MQFRYHLLFLLYLGEREENKKLWEQKEKGAQCSNIIHAVYSLSDEYQNCNLSIVIVEFGLKQM